jgi:hypothetical protein
MWRSYSTRITQRFWEHLVTITSCKLQDSAPIMVMVLHHRSPVQQAVHMLMRVVHKPSLHLMLCMACQASICHAVCVSAMVTVLMQW